MEKSQSEPVGQWNQVGDHRVTNKLARDREHIEMSDPDIPRHQERYETSDQIAASQSRSTG